MTDRSRELSRNLQWIGIIMLLVGAKLLVSFFVPALKSPGELALSGGLLLVYSIKTFRLRSGLVKP